MEWLSVSSKLRNRSCREAPATNESYISHSHHSSHMAYEDVPLLCIRSMGFLGGIIAAAKDTTCLIARSLNWVSDRLDPFRLGSRISSMKLGN